MRDLRLSYHPLSIVHVARNSRGHIIYSEQNIVCASMGHSGEAASFGKDLHVAALLKSDVIRLHARSCSGKLKMWFVREGDTT